MSAISALASGPSPRVSTVLASVSALALLVLGACQTPTDAVRAAAVPPAPTSVPATPTAAAAATATTSTSTNTSAPRSARPKKTTRTPALTNGAPTQPGGGEVITGSVNVYTFDPEPSFTPVDASSVSLAHVLADLGADAAEWYQHVQTLSNPWFEGRAPGSEGIEYAAQYLAWWMQKYGLEPAFAEGSAANPDNPLLILARAVGLQRLERFADSERELRAAIDRWPGEWRLHQALADLLMATDRQKEAGPIMKRAGEMRVKALRK